MKLKKLLSLIIAMAMLLSCVGVTALAEESTPEKGYFLTIYNEDGTEGMTIDGTKAFGDFNLKSAYDDAVVFTNNAFLFGIEGTPSFVIEMYEDSYFEETIDFGIATTINGNGHTITYTGEGDAFTGIEPELNDVNLVLENASDGTVTTALELKTALENGGTVKLGADITVGADGEFADDPFLYLEPGENAILDLNGYTLQNYYVKTSDLGEMVCILIGGDLVITDSSEEQTGSLICEGLGGISAESIYTDNGWTDAPTITIEGGTVTDLYLGDGAGVDVQGGNVTLAFYDEDYFYDEEEYVAYVEGLVFFSDPTGYVPEEFYVVQNSDGSWGLSLEEPEVPEETTAVAEINGVGYASLDEALAAANAGDTVKLLGDATIKTTTNITKSITIDGNGFKIAQTDDFSANGSNAMFDIMSDVTFKNITFDGIKTVAIMRSVSADVVIDNCVIQNCEHTVDQGLLRFALGNATITNSKFLNNNCTMAITFGFDAANETDLLTIDNCVFEGNNASGTAVVYFASGDKGTVTNTVFKNNKVTATANAATLYFGWGDGFKISGCTFEGNNVTTTGTSKRIASAIFCDGCEVTGNAFINNTATKGNGETVPTVAVGAYYGAADVSANYWNDGSKPELGVDYTVEYTRNPVAIESYYATRNEDGTLANLTAIAEPVAEVNGVQYVTLQEAIAAANTGDTITLLSDIALEGTVTVPAGKEIVLDLAGNTVSGSANTGEDSLVFVENTALLTVKDSVGDGKLTIKPGTSNVGYVVDLEGKLILESGTIEMTDSWSIGFAVDVRPNSWGSEYTEGTSFVMKGGKIVSGDGAVRVTSSSASGHENVSATFEMVDGEIDAVYDGIFIQHTGDGTTTGGHDLSVSVAGGKITSTYAPIRIYGTSVVNPIDLKISGGTFEYTGEEGTTGWLVEGFLKGTDEVVAKAEVAISGGIFTSNVDALCEEGYAAIKNLDGFYVVGKAPTATVNNLGIQTVPAGEYGIWNGSSYTSTSTEDMPLSFVMQFLADETAEEVAASPYADWYADFVITFDGLEEGSFDTTGCYLAGYYGDFGWVKIPVDLMLEKVEEGVRYPVMLGAGLGQKYDYICSGVQDFKCALYITPEILEANPNLTVNLELAVVDNTKGEDAAAEAIVKNNSYKVVDFEYEAEDFVVAYEAAIGDKNFVTLQEAIAAAEAGDTITLLSDIVLEDTVTVPADKVVTLDLAGKTISQTKAQTAAYQMILNDGSLTIEDSVGEGKISYTDSGNGGEYISDTIYNRGTLVINGGTIENLSSATVAYNGYPHAVDTYSGMRNTSVTINGGTIYCAEYSAIRMFCVSATNTADLTINGGTIKGAVDMQNGMTTAANGSLTITDGTFEKNVSRANVRFANWNGGATEFGITASVTGGTFDTGLDKKSVPAAANWDSKIVTGGTFAVKPDDSFAAEGYEFVENEEGKYEIAEKAKLFDLSGATVTLGNAMEISFFAKQEYFESEDYYAIVEHYLPGGEIEPKRYEFAEWETRRISKVDYYAISYSNLSAKQIADEIRVTIYKADGTKVSNTWIDGLSAYAYRTLGKSTTDSKLRTALVDMLNYGAAAQLQFNYNTENLANADADLYQQYATTDISHLKNERVSDSNFVGTTLSLENNIQLTGYFANLTSDMYAVATFKDHYGNDKRLDVSGSNFVKLNSKTYGVRVDNLVVADAAQLVTITVYNTDGTIYSTLVDSINGYLQRSIEDGDIYTAAAKFTLSAYNYLKKQ